MKNSVKFIAGFGIFLMMAAVSGYGQEEAKVVQGYKIDTPKATKAKKASKAPKEVTVIGYPTTTGVAGSSAGRSAGVSVAGSSPGSVSVAGYAIAPQDAPSTGTVTVEGFALPDKDPIRVQRHATLAFDNESKVSEVKIKMTEDYNLLKIAIHSSFRSGNIVVEVIDPKGENRGKYNLKTDDLVVTGDKTSVQEEVIGEMQKEFNYPIEGEWIIRAKPVAASGTINVMVSQEFRSLNTPAPEAAKVQGYPLLKEKR